jgi:hypothetical protein
MFSTLHASIATAAFAISIHSPKTLAFAAGKPKKDEI